MRYDEMYRLQTILMTVAYKVQRGDRITCESVWSSLPDRFMSLPRVVRAMKYLSDMGAIVWAERPRGRRAGKVQRVDTSVLGMRLSASRSTTEREIRQALDTGVFRWQAGKLVLDAETILTESLIEALIEAFPDKGIDGEKLFELIDGEPIENLFKM